MLFLGGGLKIMLGVLWEVINIKDDDLHGRDFNNDTNYFSHHRAKCSKI